MNRNVILSIIFVLLLGGALYFWFGSPGTAPSRTSQDTQDFQAKLAGIRRLKSLTLDTSVLSDSVFRSLNINTVEGAGASGNTITITTKTGRTNPFLPF